MSVLPQFTVVSGQEGEEAILSESIAVPESRTFVLRTGLKLSCDCLIVFPPVRLSKQGESFYIVFEGNDRVLS
jgi:hypothetical protein